MNYQHGSRRLARVDVTAHPSAAWTLRQLRDVVGFDDAHHRYLIHDRDNIFAKHLDESIQALGLSVLKSPPLCPKRLRFANESSEQFGASAWTG